MAAGTVYHIRRPGNSMEKPLPSLPSPTLTNPDMVLPDDVNADLPALPGPARMPWSERPPSPSYLKQQANEQGHVRTKSGSSGSSMTVTGKRERLGNLSRNVWLYRTSPETVPQHQAQRTPSRVDNRQASGRYDGTYASSPTVPVLQEMRLPEKGSSRRDEERRPSWNGSLTSEDMARMPEFLAKYDHNSGATDDGTDSDEQFDYGTTADSGIDEQRRRQQRDEQASLILSQRAEQILANAKKRLNLMEGNLRGARDLVAPLTAANLKRATSLGSTASTYRDRHLMNGYHHDSPSRLSHHPLQSQASSPTMRRDYHSAHWRGFSATDFPERPHTSLDRVGSPIKLSRRIPVKPNFSAWDKTLKSSKSYDSLGGSGHRHLASRDSFYARASPDPSLERVDEDMPTQYESLPTAPSSESSRRSSERHRAPSRSEDLREQMSSLKGRISSLKDRAREDNLRRQSMQNLREPSPLNNATTTAPELFYSSSPESPEDADADAAGDAPLRKFSPHVVQQSGTSHQRSEEPSSSSERGAHVQAAVDQLHFGGERVSNEIVTGRKSATGRAYSCHSDSRLIPASEISNYVAAGAEVDQRYPHEHYPRAVSPGKQFAHVESNSQQRQYAQPSRASMMSEQGQSTYEDAPDGQQHVVAHEDREDAFDYERFFLHSSMRMSGASFIDAGEGSMSSEEGSTSSSALTARGPLMTADDEDDDYDDESVDYDGEAEDEDDAQIVSAPQTPEKLRATERHIQHKRSESTESLSTLATFATADENMDDSPPIINYAQFEELPMHPSLFSRSQPSSPRNYSRPTSAGARTRPISWHPSRQPLPPRPQTAIPSRQNRPSLSDSSSERADSGVGLPNHHHQQQQQKRHQTYSEGNASQGLGAPSRQQPTSILAPVASNFGSGTNNTLSPPGSPGTAMPPDRITSIVNALLEPNGRPLGLKDKSLLFAVVENLRATVQTIQENDRPENLAISRMSTRKLEEVKQRLERAD